MSFLRTFASRGPRQVHQQMATGGIRAFSVSRARFADPADASAQSGGSRSKEAKETG